MWVRRRSRRRIFEALWVEGKGSSCDRRRAVDGVREQCTILCTLVDPRIVQVQRVKREEDVWEERGRTRLVRTSRLV